MEKNLSNQRPLVFLDFETTGTDVKKDRIVELAMIRIDPITNEREQLHSLVNPEMPIPQGATDVHGIDDKRVKKAPTLLKLLPKIKIILLGADIAGYNSNRFDIPLLYWELSRLGFEWDISEKNFIDVFKIYSRNEGRSLSDAVKHYLGREHEGAHGALSDTEATFDIFQQQIMKYPELFNMSREQLSAYCNGDNKWLDLDGFFKYGPDGRIYFTKGKHKGEAIENCFSYLKWMLSADFSDNTKKIINNFLQNYNKIS